MNYDSFQFRFFHNANNRMEKSAWRNCKRTHYASSIKCRSVCVIRWRQLATKKIYAQYLMKFGFCLHPECLSFNLTTWSTNYATESVYFQKIIEICIIFIRHISKVQIRFINLHELKCFCGFVEFAFSDISKQWTLDARTVAYIAILILLVADVVLTLSLVRRSC